MAQLDSASLWPIAFAAGVGLHLVAFRVGEWDRTWHKAGGAYIGAALAGSAYIHYSSSKGEIGLFEAFRTIAFLELISIVGVYTSMTIYRAFFHRLGKFPGPFPARISNFWITQRSVSNFHLYEEVQALHKKYGDYVRTGPTEISIANAKAIPLIHAATTKCIKGPWYDLNSMVSLQTTRNKAEHAKRRKAWDRGFNAKSLRDYEPRVAKYTDQLLTQIEKTAGKPINASDWFNFYSFDVMGDLAFGMNFNMLRDGIKHYFMSSLHGFMKGVGMFSHAVWLFTIFENTPILNAEASKFWKWVNQQVANRRKNRPSRPDVFSWVLEDFESKKKTTAQDEIDLIGDAYLIAVAGSDTTAASLTCLFYELSMHPEIVTKLQKEIDEAFDKGDIDSVGLGKLKYLQACIDETMRIHPAVPSGLQRKTPPKGLDIDGTYIPGDTIVQIPIHTVHHDPRNFTNPEEFCPERWTTKPEMVKNAEAFIPFSVGPYSCVGKQLGLMEIRAVTAHILRQFNVRFAPGYTQRKFLQGKKDCFTLALGDLDLVFDKREGVDGLI